MVRRLRAPPHQGSEPGHPRIPDPHQVGDGAHLRGAHRGRRGGQACRGACSLDHTESQSSAHTHSSRSLQHPPSTRACSLPRVCGCITASLLPLILQILIISHLERTLAHGWHTAGTCGVIHVLHAHGVYQHLTSNDSTAGLCPPSVLFHTCQQQPVSSVYTLCACMTRVSVAGVCEPGVALSPCNTSMEPFRPPVQASHAVLPRQSQMLSP